MRMDRYDDEEIKERPTRTDKNQELYTDVYLNNAYVDIADLKEVMENEEESQEEKKINRPEIVEYNYEEKNYDIVSIINEAIEKNGNNKVKRSLEDDEDVENIIESINEVQREKAAEDTLLSDLMPDRDTEVIPPLEHPILDTSILDTSIIHKDEMSNELANLDDDTKEEKVVDEKKFDEEEYDETNELDKLDEDDAPSITELDDDDNDETNELDKLDEDDEDDVDYEITKKEEKDEEDEDSDVDDSFANETKMSKKKIIFIILGILVLIGIVVGVLIWKKVIKF